MAYVPQSPVLPYDMTGFEYVLLGRAPYVAYFGTESRFDRALVSETLEKLDLAEFSDRRLGELSGGEQQRLVIARALVTEAPILLLDEPTSALDIGHQQQALELVARLRREHGLTVVSAMHDLTLAGMYADELALLHEGTVVASGTAKDVLSAETLAEFYGVRVQRSPRTRRHRGRHPPPRRCERSWAIAHDHSHRLFGVPAVDGDGDGDGCSWSAALGAGARSCSRRRVGLRPAARR